MSWSEHKTYVGSSCREGHGAMVRARCFADVASCLPCGFASLLVQDFQRNIMFLPSQYWDIVSMLCLWASHLTLKCFTWLRWKGVPGRTEMAMCMISSMRRNDCRPMLSVELRWHTNEQVQWPGGKMWSRMISGLQTWYQTINLHLYLNINYIIYHVLYTITVLGCIPLAAHCCRFSRIVLLHLHGVEHSGDDQRRKQHRATIIPEPGERTL